MSPTCPVNAGQTLPPEGAVPPFAEPTVMSQNNSNVVMGASLLGDCRFCSLCHESPWRRKSGLPVQGVPKHDVLGGVWWASCKIIAESPSGYSFGRLASGPSWAGCVRLGKTAVAIAVSGQTILSTTPKGQLRAPRPLDGRDWTGPCASHPLEMEGVLSPQNPQVCRPDQIVPRTPDPMFAAVVQSLSKSRIEEVHPK